MFFIYIYTVIFITVKLYFKVKPLFFRFCALIQNSKKLKQLNILMIM